MVVQIMQKIIAIGESVFDTVFDENNCPVSSFVGGRIANAAALLGGDGMPVSFETTPITAEIPMVPDPVTGEVH